MRGQQLKKILYIIFTLALFITFTIKGEGGDGTLSFPPVCSPLIWLWNVMVIPLLQYVHFINYCTLGPQRRKKNHCTKLTEVPTPYDCIVWYIIKSFPIPIKRKGIAMHMKGIGLDREKSSKICRPEILEFNATQIANLSSPRL